MISKSRRSFGWAAAVTLGAGVSFAWSAWAHRHSAVFPLQDPPRGYLRIGATPGDLALENDMATAVVRKSDGALIDFWPHLPESPSAEQLGSETHVDSLWDMHPVVRVDGMRVPVFADRVVVREGQVLSHGRIEFRGRSIAVTTKYAMSLDTARVLVRTELSLGQGAAPLHVRLGDIVRWGNARYITAAIGKTGETYAGWTEWIGRRGASGDLRLHSESGPMYVEFRLQHHGMAPALHAVYPLRRLTPATPVAIDRFLALEPLPHHPGAESAPLGTSELHVDIVDEDSRPLPAKLTLTGIGGTPHPSFDEDGGLSGAGRFVWTGNGHLSVRVPPGRYRAFVTAGPERIAAAWDLELSEKQLLRREARLERVVFAPGWISADLHLHQAPSVDADVSLPNRIIAIAAEGVRYAVASDHFTATNLQPTVQALLDQGRLTTPLLTSVGIEVSTEGERFGHFNVFPVHPSATIDAVNQTPSSLFSGMRRAAPRGLIQVNHPRLPGMGYFERYRMDPTTGRVPARFRDIYVSDFDAVEVFNGFDGNRPVVVRKLIDDWLHLLGLGFRYTATGNSDSHKLFYVDPGMPRNLVHCASAACDSGHPATAEAAIIEALRKGRSIVTTGPTLLAEVQGKGPGETVRGAGARVPVRIVLQAPAWIDVDWVEVRAGSRNQLLRWVPVPSSSDGVRLDTTVDIPIAGHRFIVVYAGGGSPLPNVFLQGIRPFAFTNPIWFEP